MSTIDQYRQAKAQISALENKAKQELIDRFWAIDNEKAQIKRELREDFGVKVIPKRARAKKSLVKSEQEVNHLASLAPEKAKRFALVQRKLDTQKQKLADAISNKTVPVQPIRDRIYELEDDLRLALEA